MRRTHRFTTINCISTTGTTWLLNPEITLLPYITKSMSTSRLLRCPIAGQRGYVFFNKIRTILLIGYIHTFDWIVKYCHILQYEEQKLWIGNERSGHISERFRWRSSHRNLNPLQTNRQRRATYKPRGLQVSTGVSYKTVLKTIAKPFSRSCASSASEKSGSLLSSSLHR